MDQKNQGSGSQGSGSPMKRKRGRPRKEVKVVQGENVPVKSGTDNVMSSNLTAGTTDACDDGMVGKVVTGVIEGTFNAGYLLNVKFDDSDVFLRGVVFQPGQVAPVTAANDLAPHVKMIQRKEVPIPVPNPQTEIHKSVPSSAQRGKQPLEPELPMPMSVEQVLPTETHSGIPGLLQNQPASTLVPISISSEGIPPGTSEPSLVNQPAPVMSELDHDKTVKQGETLPEFVPSSVQRGKQPLEQELPVSMSVEQVLPTESHSGIPGLLQNQPASTLVPISISSGGIPPGTSEPSLVNQPAPVMSELDHDKTVKQGETLPEFVPSSVQRGKQPLEPELPVPMSVEQVLPTESHSGISGLLQNQPASTLVPISISSEGIPPGTSEPSLVNQSAPVMSELDHDKTVKQSETLPESVPSSVQRGKQPLEPELPVPMSVEQVLPTESHSGIPGILQNEPASTLVPISISSEGIPPGTSEPGLVNQSAPLMSELDHDKTVKQSETLPESVPSSVQRGKQPLEPELPVPMSVEQVLPTETHSGIPGLLQNQPASTLVPISISSGKIPPGTSEPSLVNQSAPVMSELDHDKTVKQGETLPEFADSTRVKESSADGGETKQPEAASEITNPIPSFENTNKELITGEQPVPFVHQLNEVTRDEPNMSNIELNLIPLAAETEAVPSEQTSKTVNYFTEKQELPKTDVLEDTNVKLKIETSSTVETSINVNIPVVGSNHALETSHPEFLPSEQIGKTVPSESKSTFEGHDLPGKSEDLPSEQTNKTVDYFVEKPELPNTDVVEDMKTKLAIETSSDVDT